MAKLTKEEQEALDQANQVWAMAETKGWKEVVLPLLQLKAQNSWKDPREVKDLSKFFYDYNIAWSMAQAAKELVSFVEGQIEMAKQLEKKAKGEEKETFRIGSTATNEQKTTDKEK